MANQTDPLGNIITSPTGQVITSTASNAVKTGIDVAGGTASVIVGGAAGAVGTVVGAAVGATVAPVIDLATKANTVYELVKNPSLGGALALLGRGFPPYRNELDQFASYNYVITLACLTNFELNFPLSYRTLGPLIQIIKSGGTGGKKIPTIYETDGIVEFFIDNVNIETYVAPNQTSGHTNASGITFQVTEPYSMGQFFHNLRTAAIVAGHGNYLEAPYLLGIEFIGYDDEGNVKDPFFSKRYIPISFSGIDMRVTESGAVYDCQAIPYNETALTNSARRANTDVDMRGRTVGEVLQAGPASLTSVLNQTTLQLKNAGQVTAADQYVISFPRGTSLPSAVQSSVAAGAVTTSVNTRQGLYEALTGISGGQIPPEFEAKLQELQGFSVPQTALGEAIKQEANQQALWNAIGRAKIVKSFLDGGRMPFAEPSFSEITTSRGQVQRSTIQTSDDNRQFTFKSGSTIEEMIEEVILSSEWARNAVKQTPDAAGKITWFRIETQVFNVTNPIAEAQTGRSPRVYVYRVVPFKVDASKVQGANPNVLQTLAKQTQAVKGYNYIYTGQNTDIIDFDINFNLAFFQNIGADRGQMGQDSKNPQEMANSGPDAVTAQQVPPPPIGPARPSGQARVENSPGSNTGRKGGGAVQHVENALARMFNDSIINTDEDLINVTLKIHGDPFYICDSGIGNYLGIENPLHSQITVDGTMNPRNGVVDVVLNFRTPIDYDAEDGFVKYPLGGFLPVAMFSGMYEVITVNNNFSGGKFTQELDLVRKQGQDLTIESLASSVVSFFNDKVLNTNGTPAQQIDEKDGGVGQ